MSRIFSSISNFIFGKINPSAEGGKRFLTRHLNETLVNCPSCNGGFRGHFIASCASTVYTDDNRLRCEELREDLRQGKFDEVLSFDEFDPFEDGLLVGIIKCPSKQAVWLLICAPYEPYLRPAIMEFGVISGDESPRLLGLVDEDSWVAFEK